jgi:hypothetical protein
VRSPRWKLSDFFCKRQDTINIIWSTQPSLVLGT